MKALDPPIIVEQEFSNSIKDVWKAISDQDIMKKWYFEQINSFIPEQGFETEFVVEHEGRTFTHQWKITEVVPYKRLKYNWKYKEYLGDSYLSFVLEEDSKEGKVKLTVISETVKDFPDDVPEFTRESCYAGWQYFINGRLKEYLEIEGLSN